MVKLYKYCFLRLVLLPTLVFPSMEGTQKPSDIDHFGWETTLPETQGTLIVLPIQAILRKNLFREWFHLWIDPDAMIQLAIW